MWQYQIEEAVLSCCIVWVHHHVPRAVVLLLIKGGACIHTSWLQQYSTWNVVMESIKILGTISVWGLPRISCCGHVSAVHACAKVYSLWCANQTDTTSGSGFLVLWYVYVFCSYATEISYGILVVMTSGVGLLVQYLYWITSWCSSGPRNTG